MNKENIDRILKEKYDITGVLGIFLGTDPDTTDEDIAKSIANSLDELKQEFELREKLGKPAAWLIAYPGEVSLDFDDPENGSGDPLYSIHQIKSLIDSLNKA